MNDFFSIDKVSLIRLKDDNNTYKLLEEWYKNKEVYLQFEQRVLTLDEIKNKYYERTLDSAKIPVYLINFENIPIGIIQYQNIDEENKKIYGLDEDNIYEVDIFIGDSKLHNKGIGKVSIELMCTYLFSKKNAEKIIMCPKKDNLKAINCYKKCGFYIDHEFKTNDTIGNLQTYVLMIKDK